MHVILSNKLNLSYREENLLEKLKYHKQREYYIIYST